MKHTLRLLFVALIGAAVLTAPAAAAPPGDRHPEKRHPGYVDGTHLLQMVDPDAELVEVTLRGRLLRLFATRAVKRADEGLARILGDLVSLKAIVADGGTTSTSMVKEVKGMQQKLERDGWERFVYVRESAEESYSAYIHLRPTGKNDEDEVDGLTVLGFTGDGELLFVNLAGRIDMERIASLGERLGVPGLEDLPPASEVERKRTKKKGGDDAQKK